VLEDITLPFGKKDPAKATENISLTCNLDQSASETEQWLADTALKMDGEAISNTATSAASTSPKSTASPSAPAT
jgi:hypothetical protein